MDKYSWDKSAHSEPSRSHSLSTDKRQYPISNSGMTLKTYTNEYPNAMIRTDVTSEDLIWSKTLPNKWQGAQRGSLGLAHAVSPSVHFGGEEVQYISDTESEHSCSSADTMILLNNEQSGSHILETCIPPRPRTYQPIHSVNVPPSTSEYKTKTQQTQQHSTERGFNQIVGLRPQQLTCNTARRQLSGASSAPPGGDNHSDDGYESNDTNMSFETGSSGSLSSKDSGQHGATEAPKSILKKSGQSNSKLTQRSVHFATDAKSDKHLDTKSYGVPRQFIPNKSPKDLVKPVMAIKKKTDINKSPDEIDSPSLEDRLRDLMVHGSFTESEETSNNGVSSEGTRTDGVYEEDSRSGDTYRVRTPSWDYRDSGRRPPTSGHNRSYNGGQSLTTIPEQYHSVDRTEETISVPNSPNFRVCISKGPPQNGSVDDMDTYISTDKVKNLLSRQSSLRGTRSATPTPTFNSQDYQKEAHYGSLTNLPSGKDSLPDSTMPHSLSMPQLSSGQNSQQNVAYNSTRFNNGFQTTGVNGHLPSGGSSRTSAESSSHHLSPEISPKARQRHSCYATYAELTDMYKSMAAGGRNKRWSNSSDFSVNSYSSLRNPSEGNKSKTVYGTTADLYRMMKDQMRQPKGVAYNRNRDYNGVT